MLIELPTFIIISGVMSAVQIAVWQTLPKRLRDVVISNRPGAFIINLAGSNLIVSFTGVGSAVGVCNLAASVVFGVYATAYCKNQGIIGTQCRWVKMFNIIPLYPSITVKYAEPKAPSAF
jgi:hypothetical protein